MSNKCAYVWQVRGRPWSLPLSVCAYVWQVRELREEGDPRRMEVGLMGGVLQDR